MNDLHYDIFISYATEDKDAIARPLSKALLDKGYDIFMDELVIRLGDSITESINSGLAQSDCGLIIISPVFLSKKWTRVEMNAITNIIISSGKKVLPIWHQVTHDDVLQAVPLLADRKAALSSDGIESIVSQIQESIGSPSRRRFTHTNYTWAFYDFLPEMQLAVLESMCHICDLAMEIKEFTSGYEFYEGAMFFMDTLDPSRLEQRVVEALAKTKTAIDKELGSIATELEMECCSFD